MEQHQTTKPPQDPNAPPIMLGVKPYNRFLGNPPAGTTPEEAFKAETGYDWLHEIELQPVRDKINSMQSEISALKTKVTELENSLKSESQPPFKSDTHHNKIK